MTTLRCEFWKLGSSEVGHLQIARPQALNALNKQVMMELSEQMDQLNKRTTLRALILSGEGEKAFVAGADIKEMREMTAKQAHEMAVTGQNVFNKIEHASFPVIAAINGFALGGGLELALACDFMLASKVCKWGLPEVTLGLIPGYGGTQRLSRNLGRAIARRVALSGEIFSAQQGYEWGLFAGLYEPAELIPEAKKLAETLASRAPLAVNFTKKSINQGYDHTLEAGLQLEAENFAKVFETQDHNEGIDAFINKRPPKFEGH